MRIVSLAPYLTDSVTALALGDHLVGVSSHCSKDSLSADVTSLEVPERTHLGSTEVIGRDLIKQIKALNPTHVLVGLPLPDRVEYDTVGAAATKALLADTASQLASSGAASGHPSKQHGSPRASSGVGSPSLDTVRVSAYAPCTLNQIFQTFESLGKELSAKDKAHDLTQRMKAQLMDWGDNFYDRMKNKRVTFLTSVEPLCIGGRWLPDMINLASCVSQEPVAGGPHREVRWDDVLAFRPDVIIVAPQNLAYQASLATFKILEKIPSWDQAPATKRGEVFFCEGERLFHRPGPTLKEGMGVLVSAISGIESGYITKRDSFVRMRFLEMQRHRF